MNRIAVEFLQDHDTDSGETIGAGARRLLPELQARKLASGAAPVVEMKGYETEFPGWAKKRPPMVNRGLGVLRAIHLGSSTLQDDYCNFEAPMVVANGVGTVTRAGHQMQTGCRVSINKDNPTPYQDRRATGQITRVSSSVFTIPLPNWPDGSALFDFHMLSAYAPQSESREIRNRLHGRFKTVATFAVGGEQTGPKLARFTEALKYDDANCIIGPFGIGNNVLGDRDPASTIADMRAMVEIAMGAGVLMCIQMPPAAGNLDAAKTANGMVVTEGILGIRAQYPQLELVDEFSVTLDKATGAGKTHYFRQNGGGDAGVHVNHLGSTKTGEAAANVLATWLGANWDRRVVTLNDSKRVDVRNNQLMDGFFSSTGTVASTLSARASGTVDKSITALAVTGASSTLVCSLVARADGYGYDQQFVFTPQAAGSSFEVSLTNEAGFEFWRNLTPGEWDAMFGLTISMAGTAVVAGYGHYIETTVDGQSGRSAENMRTDDGPNDTPLSNTPEVTVITEEPGYFPPMYITKAPTAGRWVFALQAGSAAAAGAITVKIGRPTIRPAVG